MSQKAGLSIHKIEGRGHFSFKGFYIVFGRDLHGKVHILDSQWQNKFGTEHQSVEDAIATIEKYHVQQISDDHFV